MKYKDALSYIKSGDALLFLGSGFSLGATTVNAEKLPGVTSLTSRMVESINDNLEESERIKYTDKNGNPKIFNFSKISNFYANHLGKKEFVSFLKSQFSVHEFTKAQSDIVNNPWLSIFTTNYDDIVEKISARTPVSRNTNKISEVDESYSVIHVNGAIQSINYNNVNDELTLTNESYLKNKFATSGLGEALTSLIKEAKVIFFVGFSFDSDLDIARLYLTTNAKDKTFFINGELDIEDKEILDQFGHVIEKYSNSFAEDIINTPGAVINRKAEDSIRAFKKVSKKFYAVKVGEAPNLLTNLIDHSDVEEKYILDDEYVVQRNFEMISDVKQYLEKYKVLIVHSRLGNGKTTYMKWLSRYLASEYNVWFFDDNNFEKFSSDIRVIKNRQSNPIIFIDDIYKLQENYSSFKNMSEDMRFIVSGRSSILEHSVPILQNQGHFDDSEIAYLPNLDIISEKDLNTFKLNIEKNNLWGSIDKKKVLSGASFSEILTEYFKASGIIKKYADLIKSETINNTDYKQIVICILILNSLSNQLKLNDLLHSLNLTIDEAMKKSDLLQEYIDFKNEDISVKGTVLSKELLHNNNLFTIDEILFTIHKIFCYYDNTDDKMSRFLSIKKSLVSFSNLHLILAKYAKHEKSKFNKRISNYYYTIQNMNFCKRNPFFWIQFANSCIFARDFAVALKYVQNARNYAKDSLQNQYQIASTEINIYVTRAEDRISANPKFFIDDLIKATILAEQVETSYILSLFAKLASKTLLDKYNELSENYKTDIYEQLLNVKLLIFKRESENYRLTKQEEKNALKLIEIMDKVRPTI